MVIYPKTYGEFYTKQEGIGFMKPNQEAHFISTVDNFVTAQPLTVPLNIIGCSRIQKTSIGCRPSNIRVFSLSQSPAFNLFNFGMAAELEPPFYPREKLIEKQKFFQSIHKHTYLKGRYDMITSVAIPLAFTIASGFMIGRGIYNMSHGIGKKE